MMPVQEQIETAAGNAVAAMDPSLPASANPLRILLVVESSSGGAGRHVMDLAEGLIARHCAVHLLYATGRIDRIFRDRLHSMPVLHQQVIEMRRSIHPTDLLAMAAVCRYVKTSGPFDIIHGHASKGGAIARLAGMVCGIPSFHTFHGLIMMDPTLPLCKRLIYLTIERGLAMAATRLIAVSPEEARAAAALKLAAPRISIIPNGVGKPNLTPRRQARLALDLPEHALVVGFIGRLVAQKSPDVLLRAFAQASASIPNAYLAMIGSGPLANELHALTRELGISDKVRWPGERDARTCLAGFDVFALSSRKEGLPYVILEAMAAGLPVVATASAGVESLLKDGENGLVVPADDPAAFAGALLRVLNDPEQRAALGRSSLQRVAAFSIDQMVEKHLRLYRAAAKTEFNQPPAERRIGPEGATS